MCKYNGGKNFMKISATKFFASVALSWAMAVPAVAQMAMPGGFSVSPSGAATYEIPIQVAPGVAGIEPKISLSFNNQSGNGLLGLNWSLSGLSAITRCSQTKAQDGPTAVPGISYSASDRFCLDGQRLMILNGGTYGIIGSEYRTEVETYSKVVAGSVAGVTATPAKFTVQTKSGLAMEYGGTNDSRVFATGKNTVRMWGLSRVSDVKNNSMTFTYTAADATSGQSYLTKITYTENSSLGLTPKGEVVFDYEDRPDYSISYLNGSFVKTTKRLKGVTNKWDGVVVSTYTISYRADVQLDKKLSIIDSVLRLEGGLKTKLSWTIPNTSSLMYQTSTPSPSAYQAWQGATNRIWVLDVDHDGKQDLVLGPDGLGKWYWLQSNGVGLVDKSNATDSVYGAWDGRPDLIRLMDINGDGYKDIVLGPDTSGKWYWIESTENGLVDRGILLDQPSTALWRNASANIRVVNMDANRRDGIVYGPDSAGKFYSLKNVSTAVTGLLGKITYTNNFSYVGVVATTPYASWASNPQAVRVMDLNGDGRQDFLIGPDLAGRWFRLISSGAAYMDQGSISSPFSDWATSQNSIRAMDFNGDGLPDLVLGPKTDGNFYVMQSLGDGTFTTGGIFSRYGLWAGEAGRIRVGDYNRDGKDDIILGPDGGGRWHLIKGTSDGLEDLGPVASSSLGAWDGSPQRVFQLDLDGDGSQDTVLGPDGSGNWYTVKSIDSKIRMTSVHDGISETGFTSALLSAQLGASYSRNKANSGSAVQWLPSMEVTVNSYRADGFLGRKEFSYRYANLMGDFDLGRGVSGFEWMRVDDLATGVSVKTEFYQDFPYIGQASKITKTNNSSQVLAESRYDYSCIYSAISINATYYCKDPSVASNIYHVFRSGSTEKSWGLSGEALPWRMTKILDIDGWGNEKSVTETTFDGSGALTGFSKNITKDYFPPDNSLWIIGKLKKTTVTLNAPDVSYLDPNAVKAGAGGLPVARPPALPAHVMVPILDLLLSD